MKSRLVAGDLEGAREDARWALEAGAGGSDGPIGRYAASLAHLVRGEDDEAAKLAATLQGVEGFPPAVTDALVALATADGEGYGRAIRALVGDFESRTEFLEDIPVADTVLALQALAAPRGFRVALASPMLPQAES